MGLLTRACGVTAIALAATASIAKANEGWWYLLSRQGCGLSRDEETFKSPATFILTLKSIGREYSVDDRRDIRSVQRNFGRHTIQARKRKERPVEQISLILCAPVRTKTSGKGVTTVVTVQPRTAK
jgi:hypothetical protein